MCVNSWVRLSLFPQYWSLTLSFFFLWVHEATRWQHEACIHLAHNSFKCSIMGMKKCPSHQTPWYLKIKALTCSNCLSVWSWRGGELSVSSLHKSKQGEKVRSKNLKTHGNIKLCVGGGGIHTCHVTCDLRWRILSTVKEMAKKSKVSTEWT